MSITQDPLALVRLRAVRSGVVMTFLVVLVLVLYPFLPGHLPTGRLYWPVVAAAIVGAVAVASIPWRSLLGRPAGMRLLYVWSLLDIALITLGVQASGGARSHLFWLYSFTIVFSALTCYPLLSQLALVAITAGGYLLVAFTGPTSVTVADAFVGLTLLGLIMGLSSVLSMELVNQVRMQQEAAREAAGRAALLAMVAAAARSINTLDLDQSLATVTETSLGLGFDAVEICLYNEAAGTWRVARHQGLYHNYVPERPIESGIAGTVWKERKTVAMGDYAAWSGGIEEVRSAGFRTVVASPIWTSGDLRGALIAGNHRSGSSPAHVQECLELLAAQAGAALDNAQRFSERSRFEAEIAYQASHDALTDLPNRALFAELQQQALATARRSGRATAVLLLDLDRFKSVNDSLGHHAGDQLLIEVARRLREVLRPEDTLARYGGDEFAALLYDLPAPEVAAETATKILATLSHPFRVGGSELYTSASIGISYVRPGGPRISDTVREAELAMYRAKEQGKGRWSVFEPEMDFAASRRLEMETELRRALDSGDLYLVYQPIASLESGRVTGVEALLRWHHRSLGEIEPVDFIPLAEDTGLIIAIGDWVLGEACAQVRRWEEEGLPPLQVAVNLSGRQFHQPDLVQRVQEVLDQTDLPPARLTLEITETVAMEDMQTTIHTIGDLAQLGVGIALDDFGQGSSSLGALRRFPLHAVKVDKVFVAGVADDGPDRAIVSSVITLARSLGIGVTAEGIENPVQLAALRSLGCSRGQGYYLSHPVRPEALGSVLPAVAALLGQQAVTAT
ncbi:MAG TPA: EAL domain-containing protein [Acidimicrobiales bacterium]|nr:EAL domain-containing protein [Acidimicrobiales bacterium]